MRDPLSSEESGKRVKERQIKITHNFQIVKIICPLWTNPDFSLHSACLLPDLKQTSREQCMRKQLILNLISAQVTQNTKTLTERWSLFIVFPQWFQNPHSFYSSFELLMSILISISVNSELALSNFQNNIPNRKSSMGAKTNGRKLVGNITFT